MTDRKPLSWKAIRRGKQYCAPACGGGCTFEAYQKAKESAKRLASQLGPGWTYRVFENLGWHFNVLKGQITVRRNRFSGSYTAFFNARMHQTIGESRSPKKAIQNAVDSMTSYVQSLTTDLERVMR